MIGFLGIFWCAALVKRLCQEASLSRLLNARLVDEFLAWFTAKQRTKFVHLILAAVMFVAARELIALPGSVELSIVHAANVAPYLAALAAFTIVTALSCWRVARQAHRADLSYWQIRALDVFNGTFGKCARRKRGNAPSADNDDAAPEFVVAA